MVKDRFCKPAAQATVGSIPTQGSLLAWQCDGRTGDFDSLRVGSIPAQATICLQFLSATLSISAS